MCSRLSLNRAEHVPEYYVFKVHTNAADVSNSLMLFVARAAAVVAVLCVAYIAFIYRTHICETMYNILNKPYLIFLYIKKMSVVVVAHILPNMYTRANIFYVANFSIAQVLYVYVGNCLLLFYFIFLSASHKMLYESFYKIVFNNNGIIHQEDAIFIYLLCLKSKYVFRFACLQKSFLQNLERWSYDLFTASPEKNPSILNYI